MIKVHFTQGDGKGWALDEDLRQIRESLVGIVRESGVAGAEVIHAPFWQNLSMVEQGALQRAYVIAHADNPPFFYLKQPEFLRGQQWVDLWVARSREALGQFKELGLPAIHIPYTIDRELFFRIADKSALRREYGIPEDAYVIANFHRDTEGADLMTPKVQKNPEFMMAILRRLRNEGYPFHILLAGPRRHWIRQQLRREKIPYTFVGKEMEGDDFGINILSITVLNKLYNASDLYLIPSRWEGGPQSAMEAAACRCKILSVAIGVGRDILEPKSLFRTSSDAVERIAGDIRNDDLAETLSPQFFKWKSSHSTETLRLGLRELYRELPSRKFFQKKVESKGINGVKAWFDQLTFTLKRRMKRSRLPKAVSWNHREGMDPRLDEILEDVAVMIGSMGIQIQREAKASLEIVGWPERRQVVRDVQYLQWIVPNLPPEMILEHAMVIAPSVQDVVNLRIANCHQSAVAIPFLRHHSRNTDSTSGPLVVQQDDHAASLQIWDALGEGRTVIYPEDSKYYEQVFHSGLVYSKISNLPEKIAEAGRMKDELKELTYFPSRTALEKALRVLLCSA